MSTKSPLQEFQFSEISENRRKVDVQLEIVNSQHMENGSDTILNRKRDSLQSEPVFDLRKSLAWDGAFFTSPGVLDPEELFETLNFRVVDGGVDITEGRVSKSIKFESAEAERTIDIGMSNVRKSLAWDSAFFTNEGVLDAEELCIINGGFRKLETPLLSGIEEENWRPAESNSTVNSADYSLPSLEIDLFDDLRASLCHSREDSSNGANSTSKSRGEKRMQNGHVSKILATSLQARKTSSRESSPLSSHKAPKISGHANSVTKAPKIRASLGANQVKVDSKATIKTASGKTITVPKKTGLRDSSITIRSSTPSMKSSYSVLNTATNDLATSDCVPYFATKSSPQLAVSVSAFTTPLKNSAGNKIGLVNMSDSTSLFSTPKSSSSISPASSINGCSSESSSASTQQRLCFSAARHTTPYRGIPFDCVNSQVLESEMHYKNQPFLRLESRETRLANLPMKKISSGANAVNANILKNCRPSGLRMPSPKIGFFEPESSVGLGLDGGMKFDNGVQSSSSKIGTGIGSDRLPSNKTRRVKQQLLRTSIGIVNHTGTEDMAPFCLREKQQQQQRLKEHRQKGLCVSKGLGEDNKENVSTLDNQVDVLSRLMQTIDFSRDLVAEFKAT